MVEVLGPWLVPVEAVVSDPTAGAKMKSMSPSGDKIKTDQRLYLKCQHITTKTKSSQQRRVQQVLLGCLGSIFT